MAFTVYIGPQKNDFTVGLLPALLPPGHDLRGLHGTRRPAKRSDRIDGRPSRIVLEIIASQEALACGSVPSGKREQRLSFLLRASKRPGRACRPIKLSWQQCIHFVL